MTNLTYAEAVKQAAVWRDDAYADYADFFEVDREALAVLRRAAKVMGQIEGADTHLFDESIDNHEFCVEKFSRHYPSAEQVLAILRAALAYKKTK